MENPRKSRSFQGSWMEWDLKEEYNEIEIVELGLHGFL